MREGAAKWRWFRIASRVGSHRCSQLQLRGARLKARDRAGVLEPFASEPLASDSRAIQLRAPAPDPRAEADPCRLVRRPRRIVEEDGQRAAVVLQSSVLWGTFSGWRPTACHASMTPLAFAYQQSIREGLDARGRAYVATAAGISTRPAETSRPSDGCARWHRAAGDRRTDGGEADSAVYTPRVDPFVKSLVAKSTVVVIRAFRSPPPRRRRTAPSGRGWPYWPRTPPGSSRGSTCRWSRPSCSATA